MRSSTPRRLLSATIWGSVALTVIVCSVGISLTVQQYRDMEGILLDAEKRATLPLRRDLAEYISSLEERALERLSGSTLTAESLGTLGPELGFVGVPFAIGPDGTVSAPLLRATSVSRSWIENDSPPGVYLEALRLTHSGGGFDEKKRALDAVHAREDIGELWRVRSQMQLAALYRRNDRSRSAGDIYGRVLDELSPVLAASTWPSFLQVALVHAETTGEIAARDEATAAIRRGLAYLDREDRQSTLAEEEFFLRGSRKLSAQLGLDIGDDFREAVERLADARMRRTALENVGELIRSSPPPVEGVSATQRFIARFSERVVPTVWRTTSGPQNGHAPGVGFQIDTSALTRTLDAWLARNAPAAELRVSAGDDGSTSSIVPLGTLAGELSFITLGKDVASWEERLGQARRPFVLAGLLVGGLGLSLIAGLLFFYRAVRREITLARMKTEFVANVSHELKTPLTLIRLCSETLQLERIHDAEQKHKYYGVITRESERLTHLIGNVLNFASIEAGKKTYTLEPRDLAPILRETSEAYFLQFREKGFDCAHDIPEELPMVLADEEAVAQALINLLQNAVRYSTKEKSVLVRAQAAESTVRISVLDHGVGISKEDQKRVWEDYYRTKAARALGTRGSGLGLSLVHHIVDAHQGHVELESAPGAGSEFTLVFPMSANETAKGEP